MCEREWKRGCVVLGCGLGLSHNSPTKKIIHFMCLIWLFPCTHCIKKHLILMIGLTFSGLLKVSTICIVRPILKQNHTENERDPVTDLFPFIWLFQFIHRTAQLEKTSSFTVDSKFFQPNTISITNLFLLAGVLSNSLSSWSVAGKHCYSLLKCHGGKIFNNTTASYI